MKVFLALGILILEVLVVSGVPLKDDPAYKWEEMDPADRQAVLRALTPLIRSAVGPIYITFGKSLSSFKSNKNETYLFDSYQLHVPGNQLPYVLLSAATSSDPHEPSPPFQRPPLANLGPFGVGGKATGGSSSREEPPSQFPMGLEYYRGVPILTPKALGKISLKMSLVKKLVARRDPPTKSSQPEHQLS